MLKKAVIFDLDNTIYSVHTIADELFAPLFALIGQDPNQASSLEIIKKEIMRRPFQQVAREFNFSEGLTDECVTLLKNIDYKGKIEAHDDYEFTKDLAVDKFLVTTGFLKLQESKIDGMKIRNDFKEIHIIDPSTSVQTKKDVFADIMERYHYEKPEVLVVGDDVHSEIKAAHELGIEAVLYDKLQLHTDITSIKRIGSFEALQNLLYIEKYQDIQ
jgi:putative hydrolase of the HAD superfamily